MASDSTKLRSAALLGGAGGLRTFTPAATLALRGRLSLSPRLQRALLIAAVGELVVDKLPFAHARTEVVPYAGRVGAGALCGSVVAGPRGGLAGAGAAAAATMVGYQCRMFASRRAPATRVALIEDAITIAVANFAAGLAR